MTPTLFLAVMIIRELRQTASQKKQQPVRRETSDIQRATVYILTSLLAYMLMILPGFPSLVMYNFHPEDSVVLMWAFISFICHPIYGVLNVMIFVGMNKHFYHKCCRKILRKRCNLRQDIEDKGVFNSSNSLTLGRWKFRILRPELESVTNFGSNSICLGQNQLYYINSLNKVIKQILVSTLTSESFCMFSSEYCWTYCYYSMWIAKMQK